MRIRALYGFIVLLAFVIPFNVGTANDAALSPSGGSLTAGLLRESSWLPVAAKPPLLQTKETKGSSAKKSTKKKSSKKKKKKKRKIRVSGSFVLQTIYDDNILRYPDVWIEEFRRNDPPEKYHVDTYDDAIISPRLFLTFRSNPLGKKETRLYLSYITWQYVENPIKDNDSWGARLRQYVKGSNFLEGSYTLSPPNYIKHLTDRDPYLARSTTPREWKPFKGVRHGIELMYSHRFHKRLTATIEGGRVLRYYNRPFLENDNWEWNANTTLSWSPTKIWRFYGKYMYADADARGLDTVDETIETSDDGDGSYERDLYEVRVRYRPPGGIWVLKGFEVKGQRMNYFFTGDKPLDEDPLHTGRGDEVNVFEAYITTKKLWGPVNLKWGYRFAQRTSSLPGTFEGEDAEDKDYKNNRTWLEARYAF
jgi:hypothetical protein